MTRRWCAICFLCEAEDDPSDGHSTADHIVSALRTKERVAPTSPYAGLLFMGGMSLEAAAAILIGAALRTVLERRMGR